LPSTKKIGAKIPLGIPTDAKMMNYEKPTGELVLLPSTSTTTKQKQQYVWPTNLCMLHLPVSRGDLCIDAITGEVCFTMLSNTLANTAMESNLMQVLRQTKCSFSSCGCS
jgi:hypothetical protein